MDQIQKIFPGLLNICAKLEEIPSTSKDAIVRQTCGAGGPFRENSAHMQTSVPGGTLNKIYIYLLKCFSNSRFEIEFNLIHDKTQSVYFNFYLELTYYCNFDEKSENILCQIQSYVEM